MKAGDTVTDAITGETWVLAYYDDERDEAAWSGWPEGYVERARERLTVVEECTPAEEYGVLLVWARMVGSDVRTRAARRLLERMAAAAPYITDRDPGDEEPTACPA